MKHKDMSDAELLVQAQGGDSDAMEHLLRRHSKLVGSVVRDYYLVGGEREDLEQAGMIGLWAAILRFDPTSETPFTAFAAVCIRKQIIGMVKRQSRQKQGPLNAALSLDEAPACDGSPRLANSIRDPRPGPAELLVQKDECQRLRQFVRPLLSNFEMRVVEGYARGYKMVEVAQTLRCSTKAVDNARSRVKKKMARGNQC